MPLPNLKTPNIVRVSNRLPMVRILISHTMIQNANVFRLDIFNVSSESAAFDFIFFDFISRIRSPQHKNRIGYALVEDSV